MQLLSSCLRETTRSLLMACRPMIGLCHHVVLCDDKCNSQNQSLLNEMSRSVANTTRPEVRGQNSRLKKYCQAVLVIVIGQNREFGTTRLLRSSQPAELVLHTQDWTLRTWSVPVMMRHPSLSSTLPSLPLSVHHPCLPQPVRQKSSIVNRW